MFLNVCKQIFHISHVRISQKVKGVLIWNLQHFHMKTKIIICSIKEINRLKKEIKRLLNKRMSNIYLKVTIKTFSKLRFSEFEQFVTGSVFEELQLTQISLNFKTSCCNLKSRGLARSRIVCGFSIILILTGIMTF